MDTFYTNANAGTGEHKNSRLTAIGLTADRIERIRRVFGERHDVVGWKYEKANGKAKADKKPINPRTGFGATDEPRTWGTLDEALAAVEEHQLDGIGLKDIPAADLDACRDPATGKLTAWAADLLDLAATYAEVSPSGTGIKQFFARDIPEDVRCKINMPGEMINGKKPAIELNCNFYTITGELADGAPEFLNDTRRPYVEKLCFYRDSDRRAKRGRYNPIDDLDEMLSFIDSSDYDLWYRVAFALKNEVARGKLTEARAFDIWVNWSKSEDPHDSDAELARKWAKDLATPAGEKKLTIGSIIYWAREGGWEGGSTIVPTDPMKLARALSREERAAHQAPPVRLLRVERPGVAGRR